MDSDMAMDHITLFSSFIKSLHISPQKDVTALIKQYQLSGAQEVSCPDCEHSESSVEQLVLHMWNTHKEDLFPLREARERRFQERKKIFLQNNPPTPKGKFHIIKYKQWVIQIKNQQGELG